MWKPRADTFNYTPNPGVSKDTTNKQTNLEKINESTCLNDAPSNKNLCHKLTPDCYYSRARYIQVLFGNSGQLICQESWSPASQCSQVFLLPYILELSKRYAGGALVSDSEL